MNGTASSHQGLDWINTLYREIKERLFYRTLDKVLIVPPNQVYRLNEGGLRMLEHLSAGQPIQSFPGLQGKRRIEETELFFQGLAALYAAPSETSGVANNPGFESVPYDFTYTKLPILGEIAVTYRCNNQCLFCYVSLEKCPANRKELPTRKIKRIIDIFAQRAQIPFFSFTGGEPLLRRDIEELTEYAVSKAGLTVNLVSNGTLCTEKRARSLRNAGLGSAQISIEAAESDLHNRLVGRKGAFRATLHGIENMQRADIPVQTNTTLNALNRDEILKLPSFLKSRGVRRFAVNLFIPAGTGETHPECFLSYSDAAPTIEALRHEAQNLGLTFFWYSPTPYCIFNPLVAGLGNKSCAAADGLLSVSPAGDVLPCSSYPLSLGNLFSEDFDAVWFSKRAKYFKNKHYAPSECSECSAFYACQGACPLYWSFTGTAELQQRIDGHEKHREGVEYARVSG